MSEITLTELRDWTPTHLHDYAANLTRLAASHDSTLATVNASALAQAWIGLGRLGQEGALAEHSAFVGAGTAQLSASAAAAETGANALWGTQQQILATVDGATAQGFTVDEQTWEVKDPIGQGTPLYFAREPEREAVQTVLQGQLQAWDGEEQATAAGMTLDGASAIAPLDGSTPLDNTRLNDMMLGKPGEQVPPDYIRSAIASLPGDSRYDQLRSELTALEHQPCTWNEFDNKFISLVGSTAGTTVAAVTAETGLGAAMAGLGAVATVNAADSVVQCLDKGVPGIP